MKYNFLEALIKVEGTTQRIKPLGKQWSGEWNIVGDDNGRPFLKTEKGYRWWPSLEYQKSEIWEVEQKEIFVWGQCANSNHSMLYTNLGNDKEILFTDSDQVALFSQKGLFPKDKFQKYKLVPVKDDE